MSRSWTLHSNLSNTINFSCIWLARWQNQNFIQTNSTLKLRQYWLNTITTELQSSKKELRINVTIFRYGVNIHNILCQTKKIKHSFSNFMQFEKFESSKHYGCLVLLVIYLQSKAETFGAIITEYLLKLVSKCISIFFMMKCLLLLHCYFKKNCRYK